MNATLIMPYLMFIGFSVYAGFGITVFIVYHILNKFNNYGDFSCGIDEYTRKGIHFMRNLDEVPKNESNFLFSNFGDNPYEGREHKIPEQLMKNAPKAEKAEDFLM